MPMKYTRLTQEQFHALAEDFALFLAAQSIDAKSWDLLKNTDAEAVDRQLDAFSDLVWEEVLTKAVYLEHRTISDCFVFKAEAQTISVLRFFFGLVGCSIGQKSIWLLGCHLIGLMSHSKSTREPKVMLGIVSKKFLN